jgi:putative addiction module component (TIGR02574 family)
MSPALREELSKLSVAERLELVQELWDSIADAFEREAFPLTEAQREEIERRIRELDEHPDRAIPWDQAREQLRARRRPE